MTNRTRELSDRFSVADTGRPSVLYRSAPGHNESGTVRQQFHTTMQTNTALPSPRKAYKRNVTERGGMHRDITEFSMELEDLKEGYNNFSTFFFKR